MSAQQQGNFGSGSKKAVHVKWAGKTIALGTFPAAEADEKCARAKALTRAWRSTMRPKPSRDWVMVELERLGVRVVSGRLGRKAGEEEEAEKKPGGSGEMPRAPPTDRNNSLGWSSNADLDSLMQRRSSSLGLSLMNDSDLKRRSSLSSLGPALGLDSNDPAMPPHRPLVGGGAAAAYEAARADHYAQKREEQQRRASSLGLGMGGGNLGAGSGMPQMGLSVNPNQHYEMLKLHHMNLLNEIQETTLMMNLYQQQQLQQQQQQLQQQQASADGNDQMAMLLSQQQGGAGGGMDSLYSNAGSGLAQRGSLGLGVGQTQSGTDPQMQMLRQQQQLMQSTPGSSSLQQEFMKTQEEQAALESRLKKLKDDIARRQKEAEELQKIADSSGRDDNGSARKRSSEEKKPDAKRVKAEKDGGNGD
mmetsp:Transcript_76498/g.115126  ORF Transcript_76498/g.115126 Transcript_76498/m.115126 type:complete len:418 (+) Transcript_76498:586-1839(+)